MIAFILVLPLIAVVSSLNSGNGTLSVSSSPCEFLAPLAQYNYVSGRIVNHEGKRYFNLPLKKKSTGEKVDFLLDKRGEFFYNLDGTKHFLKMDRMKLDELKETQKCLSGLVKDPSAGTFLKNEQKKIGREIYCSNAAVELVSKEKGTSDFDKAFKAYRFCQAFVKDGKFLKFDEPKRLEK